MDTLKLREKIRDIINNNLEKNDIDINMSPLYTKLIADSVQRSFHCQKFGSPLFAPFSDSECILDEFTIVEAIIILHDLNKGFLEFCEHYGIKKSRLNSRLWRWPNEVELSFADFEWDGNRPRFLESWGISFGRYLKKEWLQHDHIDASIIHALFSVEFLESVSKQRYRGYPSGNTLRDMIIYHFMGREFRNYPALSPLVLLLLMFIFWIFVPAIFIYLAGDVMMLSFPVGIIITICVMVYFFCLATYNVYKIIDNYQSDRFCAMRVKFARAAFRAANNWFIYPSFMQKIIRAATEKGIFFSPTISVVLERLSREKKIMIEQL